MFEADRQFRRRYSNDIEEELAEDSQDWSNVNRKKLGSPRQPI